MRCFSTLFSDSLSKEISDYGATQVSHQVSNKKLTGWFKLCKQNCDMQGLVYATIPLALKPKQNCLSQQHLVNRELAARLRILFQHLEPGD